MRLFGMTGYKLFKETDDGNIHMIRIVHVRKPYKITESTKEPSEITIYDYDTDETKKVRVDSLKEYTPLKPDGILTFNIVNVVDPDTKDIHKDVMVTGIKYLEVELGLSKLPFVVCRQSITDIFNNLAVTNINKDMLVGLSVSQNTCPANFDFRIMLACSDIVYSEMVNFYRNDLISDLYSIINIKKFNSVLEELFDIHAKTCGDPKAMLKNEHGGWCKNLPLLLEQNNFQFDINEMLGITGVEFNIDDFTEDKVLPGKEDQTYKVANQEFHDWLCWQFKININEAAILEFDHDINLADFNDNRYFLFRDINNKLFLIVYTIGAEKFEADLEAKYNEMDFSTKFKLAYFDKYK